jgi:peptide/nickel transport system permease protein
MTNTTLTASGTPGTTEFGQMRVDRSTARRFFTRPGGWFFTALLVVITIACFIGPFFALSPASVEHGTLEPPNLGHLLGTDQLGRDLLARMLSGGQISLIVGLTVGVLCLAVGVAVGGIAGYFGGVVDSVFMKITEYFQVIPGLVLALVATAMLGSSLPIIVIILSLTLWPQVARLVRIETMRVSELGYVECARAAGFGPLRILVSDVIPNLMAPVLVTTTMTAGRAILYESGLSFLGLGDADTPSWGALLNNAQSYLQTAPWLAIAPGLAILLVVLAVNVLGDVLNDILNPTLSRVK